jgi:hypothetical protein
MRSFISLISLGISATLFLGCSELLKKGSVAPLTISTADSGAISALAFGNVRTGEENTKLLTLTNNGSLTLKQLNFSFENSGKHFAFAGGHYPGTNGNCGTELKAGESCQFELAFQPHTVKGISDTLVVDYTNDVKSFSIRTTLSGEGLTGFSLSGRAVSMTQESALFTSQIGGNTVIHLVYASDEYCAQFDCGATNIVYRSSADNFARRIDITQNKAIASSLPRLVVKSDGTVVIAYLSKEFNASVLNVAVRTLAAGATVASDRLDITNATVNAPANPFLAITSGDLVYLAYDSKEYCGSNSCSNRKIAIRTSNDNFSTRLDVGTGLSGNCSEPQIAIQRGTDTAHLVFMAPGVSYTSGYTTSASTFSSITSIVLNGYQPHSSIGVKSNGEVFLAYANYGAGPLGTCPNGWEYDYRTSSDNFSHATSFGCEIWAYPGVNMRPAVVVDSSDVVHVAYATNEGNNGQVVAYRNSSDAFSDVKYVSGYGGWNSYAALALGSGGMKYVVSSTTSHFTYNGLNLYSGVSSFTRQSISGSATGAAKFAADSHGAIWVAYLSSDYCQSHSCSLLNLALRKLNSDDAPVNVTTFTSASSVIGGFMVFPYPDGQVDVVYDSLEYNGTKTNLVLRRSIDGFASPTYLTTDSGYDNAISSGFLDSTGVLHIVYARNSQVFYKKSSDWNSVTMVNATSYAGYVPAIAGDSTGSKVAVSYGGNETGIWAPAVRDNSNNFSSRLTSTPGARPYNTRLVYDNLGSLFYFYQSQEAVSGVYNFAYRSSADNFTTRNDPFTFTSASKLSNCYITPALAVSDTGVTHMLYASGGQNSDQCNLEYRTSSDWSAATDITTGKNATPDSVFLDPTDGRVTLCFTTSFNAYCMGL